MRHRDRAICLRTVDYSETSQIVHFLTRDAGAVRLIAKGTKRPKSKSGGAIDLLVEGDLVFSQKNPETLGTLIEFAETVSHSSLRRDAARLNTALYAIELTGAMLAPADPHPEVFDLLARTLERLGEDDAPLRAVLAWFQWRLLRFVGLLGSLTECVSCGAALKDVLVSERGGLHHAEMYFSSRLGGILCDGCEAGETEKLRLAPAGLGGLAALAAAEAGRKVILPEPQAAAVNRLLCYHVTAQLDKALRMAKYVISQK
jgi:DNA repair protein RecO (recombination protein O)